VQHIVVSIFLALSLAFAMKHLGYNQIILDVPFGYNSFWMAHIMTLKCNFWRLLSSDPSPVTSLGWSLKVAKEYKLFGRYLLYKSIE